MKRGLCILDGCVLAGQITHELGRPPKRGRGGGGGRSADDVPQLAKLATELGETSRHPTDVAQELADRNGRAEVSFWDTLRSMRFELSGGTSNKFWEIDRAGKVLHFRYGRIGTAGQTVQKAFASPDAAVREHGKLIAAKRKKGYAETSVQPKRAAPKPSPTIKSRGPAADTLGALQSSSSALWLIAADATDAAGWRGTASAAKEGPVAVGRAKGVRAHISARAGWSGVWATKFGIALVDAALNIDDLEKRNRALALRVAQWPVTVRPKRIGTLVNHTGAIALVLPHRDGSFSPREIAKALSGAVVADKARNRILVPLPTGIYDVERYPFRPVRQRDAYSDELGAYGDCVLITYRDRLPATYRT